jgi:hypothetical protein
MYSAALADLHRKLAPTQQPYALPAHLLADTPAAPAAVLPCPRPAKRPPPPRVPHVETLETRHGAGR